MLLSQFFPLSLPYCVQSLFSMSVSLFLPRKKGPSTDEQIKKLSYLYTMEYFSAIEKHIWDSSSEVDEPRAC